MTTLVVIPARGGSKGIPRKNLLEVAGKPLIVWTIEQALAMTEPRRVVVSTEDDAIAAVARAAGAEVVERPADLALDESPTEPAVEHAIATVGDDSVERVMLLQATSPIRLPGTLDRAVAEHRDGGFDSLVGVVPQAPFLWWSGKQPRADYDIAARPRRQDLRPEQLRYRETGSLYVTAPEIYLQHHNRLGGRIGLFVMDEIEGVDIDTDVDLRLTEQALRRAQNGSAP